MNNLNNILRLMSRTRILSANHGKHSGILQQLAKRSTSTSIYQKIKEKEVFHDALPGIIDSLIASPKISQLPEVGQWLRKVFEHNLSGGKHSRGLMTMFAYEMLEKPENITEEYLKLSRVLGWCTEILQGYFLIIDDIMDASTTRRGATCWYLMPNVGMGAINDTVLLNSCITEILETYFLKTAHFTDLVRIFHEAILYTSMGQHIDFTMGQRNKHDYSLFTVDRYNTIVQHKTSYYTFRLPMMLGLSLVKDVDKKIYSNVQDISFKLGNLFQIQDDYIDCYGDAAVTGKVGTDIQEGKCSWLAVTALQLCNKEQKDLFTKNYASTEPENVASIKNLYNELRLPELYKQKEKKLHDEIISHVESLPSSISPNFFYKLLEGIYERKH